MNARREWAGRIAAILSAALLLSSGTSQAAGLPPKKQRPNVLFLLTDDQRADAVGAYGNRVIQTPNIDRLAGSGLVFSNTYCMGSDMGAVCFPSRSMLLSGLSLFHLKHKQGGHAVRYPI